VHDLEKLWKDFTKVDEEYKSSEAALRKARLSMIKGVDDIDQVVINALEKRVELARELVSELRFKFIEAGKRLISKKRRFGTWFHYWGDLKFLKDTIKSLEDNW